MSKKKEFLIKILILILLLILVFVTSFRTGSKFYILQNTLLEKTEGAGESNIARWNFRARVIIENEVILDEQNI